MLGCRHPSLKKSLLLSSSTNESHCRGVLNYRSYSVVFVAHMCSQLDLRFADRAISFTFAQMWVCGSAISLNRFVVFDTGKDYDFNARGDGDLMRRIRFQYNFIRWISSQLWG